MPTMCTSSLSLNTRTDGASTTSRRSPFHTLGVLTVRKRFLTSKWNLGSLRAPKTTTTHLISQSVRQRNHEHQTVIDDVFSAGDGERQTDRFTQMHLLKLPSLLPCAMSWVGDAGSPIIHEANARKELRWTVSWALAVLRRRNPKSKRGSHGSNRT
ncbi:Urokinase-type plasminogen activator [Varanus komodoensis]|nr:Urokinase-type plasminogen activator [Varanus komodoensis]